MPPENNYARARRRTSSPQIVPRNSRQLPKLPYGAKPDFWNAYPAGKKKKMLIPFFEPGQPSSYYTGPGRV